MRAATMQAEVEYEPWDPASPEAFTTLAGSQFLRVEDGNAVCRQMDGREEVLPAGWLAIRKDEGRDGETYFFSPRAFQGFLRELQPA
jgi:hypothetical protein